uniref:mRNA (guanine-N(7))-methyltransferase n=1 Tax=Pseudo-nitzschia australis TaxID=44445 RepID=A0A7S4AT26_9STRA|mmetsp:Transcript_26984/g.59326  ORF Transcript_26984/g.59326 Transcript_26984/m.59326 type:complete len:907 (+) Transcript_26984:167-2887(+)|eukprot:CAMPEP_0168163780 /NCGR_PEP_ID=MMETSP0139_2-20121125/564_1 /TAXON_ID=44445 /ORGANISM="Pseudo-nitzschia australis, Strain 10249 10 AB" /LENGTH=906 /DNA_ID=CAMNT_0008080709 /DNA_START=106 /DNA_END=2826 /DNA_ORIENTATION=-
MPGPSASLSSYPVTPPANKHDFLCVRGASDPSSPSAIVFSSSSELFRRVIGYDDKDLAKNGAPESKAFIYSYKDGPEYPGPLSRSLLVLGYADRSLSTVRKIIDADQDEDAIVCDGLHSCTIAVQLADEPKRYERLEKRHKVNSTSFAEYVKKLHENRQVAILAKDKYDRFGMLVPFGGKQKKNEKTGFGPNDFAAKVYIGDVQEVMNFLAGSSSGGRKDSANSSNHDDGWKPTTPPLPPGGNNASGWKPTTPPLPSGGGGNPWDNNDDGDDDGPTFRPDDDSNDGPTFRPDDGDEDGGGGWKPTTPPIPPTINGDNGGSDGMPWETTEENSNGGGGSDGVPWKTAEESTSGGSGAMPWESAPNDSGGGSMPWENSGDNDNNDNGGETSSSMPWDTEASSSDPPMPWAANTTDNDDAFSSNKRSFDDMNEGNGTDEEKEDPNNSKFHSNTGAAAADAFYSGLTRDQKTRDKSILYHMKCFNNWVKATQIAELDPNTGTHKQPLRVLDLACGKGGDLTKWTIHKRGMRNYVGIDVARGSLKDAAERARGLRKKNKLSKAVFACADLGSDVPGRKRSPRSNGMQKLLTWSLEDEAPFESGDPEFQMVAGGGVSPSDSFDIVSIQFAIHYMMQTGKRARRFFHTVSQLLDVGGNLAFTTIDARVVVDHMMNLGHNFHFQDGKEPDFTEVVVQAGGGVCKLKFEPHIVKKILQCRANGTKGEEDLFGLEYTFTLVEGDDHAAGMGDAVNLPEWLIPIPVLIALGKEAGLELEYAHNFHEFYQARSDPNTHHAAHMLLSNMKVPNRKGTISDEEWSISRLYLAVRFRKVRESSIIIEDEDDGDDQSEANEDEEEMEEPTRLKIELDPMKAKKMYPMAMLKAKRNAGDQWNSFSKDEKEERTQIELEKLAAK